MGRLRILLVSDLHGSSAAYGKLSNAIKFYRADVVVFAGDLTGKALVPIVRDDGSFSLGSGVSKYLVNVFGDVKAVGDKDLDKVIKDLRGRGYYPLVTDKAGYEELAGNRDRVRETFVKLMINALEEDLGKVVTRYREAGVKLLVMPGNDDYPEIADYVKKNASDVLVPIDEDVVEFNGYYFLGFGYSTPTPWNTPREVSEEELRARVEKLIMDVDQSRLGKLIMVLHDPPYNTLIDQAYQLSKDFKPVVRGGGEVLRNHVGSKSVRALIEGGYSPLMGMHGHIHEAPGIDYVRSNAGVKVPVINAGSEYSEGVLRMAYLIIEDNKLKNYFLLRGG
ncbi:metallophosphoesterase [Vulcanisaeta souniana]|uniref:metallophosphoesterase family protein n=1 Tax=Vulcanisaeta souniana TaxID=164452 RepID=UPI0006D09C77|nr:metallophosphoesterase [Vulcanisaeta souniana]